MVGRFHNRRTASEPTNQCLDNDKSAVSSDPTGSAVNYRLQANAL